MKSPTTQAFQALLTSCIILAMLAVAGHCGKRAYEEITWKIHCVEMALEGR